MNSEEAISQEKKSEWHDFGQISLFYSKTKSTDIFSIVSFIKKFNDGQVMYIHKFSAKLCAPWPNE